MRIFSIILISQYYIRSWDIIEGIGNMIKLYKLYGLISYKYISYVFDAINAKEFYEVK